MTYFRPQRGYALLIAVILTSVILSVGLSLAALSYKDVLLASSAKDSSSAFYAADAALECALYADQQQDAFDYTTPAGALNCAGTGYSISVIGSGATSTMQVPSGSTLFRFNGGSSCATVTVYKGSTGHTQLYATGYDTCNLSDPRLLERGIQASY